MHAGCPGGDEQLGCDFPVAASGSHQPQNLLFPWGEPERHRSCADVAVTWAGELDARPPGKLVDLLQQRLGRERAGQISGPISASTS